MDNLLFFYGEAVRKEITFIRNDEGEVIRATFSSSSRFPSKEGVFNNNRITAFGDTAKRLEKACSGKEYPLFMSFTAEQSAYKTTEGAVRQSLTLKDFNVITDAGHPGVNNHCIFFKYTVENIYFKDDEGTGETVRANFSASSSANAKVTNENRFVAFGDVATRLKKCKVSGPCTMTIDAEQKASKYKDEIQQSYVIKDFRIERFNKSETEPEEVKEVIEPDYAINGIDELKEFLK